MAKFGVNLMVLLVAACPLICRVMPVDAGKHGESRQPVHTKDHCCPSCPASEQEPDSPADPCESRLCFCSSFVVHEKPDVLATERALDPIQQAHVDSSLSHTSPILVTPWSDLIVLPDLAQSRSAALPLLI
jgi:hypothetical protein